MTTRVKTTFLERRKEGFSQRKWAMKMQAPTQYTS